MNDIGQVGDGTTSSSDAPVPVEGITTAVAIESSYVNTYAVLSDGTVRGWGLANSGSLGSGAPPDLSATPVAGPGARRLRVD